MNPLTKRQKTLLLQTVIVLISTLTFVPYIGTTHLFDWDEINFAESAREMLVTGNFLDVQINYTIFWEKPPLFFWLQALSMKLFGVNEFAARFPNALVGIITSLLLFNIGNKLYNRRTGLLWMLIHMSSFLPFFYFKSGIIDPLFNMFIFLGIYHFYLFASKQCKNLFVQVFLSAMFIGLATLTKGPVALLLFLLTAFTYMSLYQKYKDFLKVRVLGIYLLTYAFFGGFWFLLQLLNGNYAVLADFVVYMVRLLQEEDAGHGGFWGYHFVILFIGVFPASVFALRSICAEKEKDAPQQDFKRWMSILFLVVLILFTIVKTKIIHYSSLCYYPLSFFAVLSVNRILDGRIKFVNWMRVVLSILAFLWGSCVVGLRYVEKYKQKIFESDIIQDDFALGNLQAQVHWPFIISLIGILYIMLMFYFSWFHKKARTQLFGIFISSLIFAELVVTLVVPRIEQYTQNAAITFYQNRIGEDCYVSTYGFKSYAHYFYTQMPNHSHTKSKDADWLLSGNADKRVYIVCKNTSQDKFEQKYPSFEHIETKNGYAFYVSETELDSISK